MKHSQSLALALIISIIIPLFIEPAVFYSFALLGSGFSFLGFAQLLIVVALQWVTPVLTVVVSTCLVYLIKPPSVILGIAIVVITGETAAVHWFLSHPGTPPKLTVIEHYDGEGITLYGKPFVSLGCPTLQNRYETALALLAISTKKPGKYRIEYDLELQNGQSPKNLHGEIEMELALAINSVPLHLSYAKNRVLFSPQGKTRLRMNISRMGGTQEIPGKVAKELTPLQKSEHDYIRVLSAEIQLENMSPLLVENLTKAKCP